MADHHNERQTMISNDKESRLKQLQRKWLVARWTKRIIYILIALLMLGLLILIVFTIVVLIRAATVGKPDFKYPTLFSQTAPGINDNRYEERAQRLAEALKYQTISSDEGINYDKNLFPSFHNFLNREFPCLHNSSYITREVINKDSLLYFVEGTDNGNKLPYMLTAHLDVVPADNEGWEYPPFAGIITNATNDTEKVEDYIYGRGAFDDKGSVMGILEALEYMCVNKNRTKRSFYIAFGHDEEISGKAGAGMIAKALQDRGQTQLDFILDEGYFVTRGIVPGADEDVALIGVTEKGALTIRLTVEGEGSHSSFPPWESAIGIMANALEKLEENKLPSMLGEGTERYTLEYVSPHVQFGYSMLYANLWLFSGLMSSVMQHDDLLNTIIRTTTALTVVDAGSKYNVVPSVCTAIVNHRVHPSQTIQDVIDFDRKVIDDSRVKIEIVDSFEAHPVSPFDPESVHYHMLEATIAHTYDKTVIVPGLMIANTDMRSYLNFTNNIYRFIPTILDYEDTARFHGDNERISVENYAKGVSFYHRLFFNADVMYDYALEQ